MTLKITQYRKVKSITDTKRLSNKEVRVRVEQQLNQETPQL